MKNFKRQSATLFILCVLLFLTSCASVGSKHPKTGDDDIDGLTYDEIVEELSSAWDGLDRADDALLKAKDEISRLNDVIKGNQLVAADVPAIGVIDDGTGRATFVKPESRLKFPNPVVYPNSQVMAASPLVSLSGVLTIEPSSLWNMRIEGNSLSVSTDSGIYGTIVCGSVPTATKSDVQNIREYLYGSEGKAAETNSKGVETAPAKAAKQGLLAEIPPNAQGTKGTDRGLYVASAQHGVQVVVSTFINVNPATVRIGLLSYKGVSLAYCFVYELDAVSEKEDIITALVNTLTIAKNRVSVE